MPAVKARGRTLRRPPAGTCRTFREYVEGPQGAELRAALLEALDGLTAVQRQALFLRYVDEAPAEVVALRLDVTKRVAERLCDAAETKLAGGIAA